MTRNVDGNSARRQQMTHGFDQLTADQEQMTREITKLQAVEVLYKNSEPSPRPDLAPPRNPVPRPGTDGALTATCDRQGRRTRYGRPMVEHPRIPAGTGPCAWSVNWQVTAWLKVNFPKDCSCRAFWNGIVRLLLFN
jgi:hypothetical protein